MNKAKKIARRLLMAGLLIAAPLGGGCASMSNTDKGVLAGGALGATAGGLIGGSKGKAGVGALAGGALGAVAGGLTGHAIDSSERKMERKMAAQANPPLSLEDVVQLTSNGTSDDLIVNQIHSTNSVYQLTAQQIIYLQNNGVREPVIRVMQQTASRPVPVRQVYTAVPVAQPVYVAPPPPPIGVGVGVTFRR